MMDKCPFCGSDKANYNPGFMCGTVWLPTPMTHLRSHQCYEAELTRLRQQVKDIEEVLEDKRRLTREIDIIINGEDAAKQASLCDLIPQLTRLREVEKWAREAIIPLRFLSTLPAGILPFKDGYYPDRAKDSLAQAKCLGLMEDK